MTVTDDLERRIRDAVATRRALVNDAIDEELPPGHPERLYDASRHLPSAGGKRLRSALLHIAAEAVADVEPGTESYRSFPTLDGDTIDLQAAAVSVELVHSFTLAHDDIMDEDELRRGEPSVHEAFDVSTAILAGDTLFARGIELMSETGAAPDRSVAALRRMATTCVEICEGQSLDLELEAADGVSVEEYMEMIELKTAVLYGASASIPAILVGADDETVESLYRYGVEAGTGFQIHDDVLDLTAPSDRLGKRRGSDLIEGKETLITIHAREQGVDVDDLFIDAPRDEVDEAAIDAAIEPLRDAGSIEFARDRSEDLIRKSKDRLDVLPANDGRRLLEDIADFLVQRGH